MSKKTKQQKRKARRKAFEKERNVAKNQAKPKFRLDVLWPEGWKTMGGFFTMAQVEKYVAEQEEIRAADSSDILEGRIFDIASGKMVSRIAPYKKKEPEGVEAVKDLESKVRMEDCKNL